MRISLLTLGCRTNQAESARLEQMLSDVGHQIVSLNEGADICIVNTCSVTAKADYQSRQSISRALKTKAEVIVTGCYAELNSKLLREKNLGIKIIGNEAKANISNIIPKPISTDTLNINSKLRHRPTIKIQDGCNNACSYCIIPSARGRSRSVNPLEILEEACRLESLGFGEIVLSGIHLGIYGKDLTFDYNLVKLLEELLSATSKTRIRLSSIEINELSDQLLNTLQHDRICRHLHIPLQSGDDTILSRMKRSYTTRECGQILDKIVRQFSNISLGTDVIVGFPTEADSHFNNMMTFLDSQPYTYLHVFPYSSRAGTAAANFKPQVSDSVKKHRVAKMHELNLRKKAAFLEANTGMEHDLIIETINESGFMGTTSNYIKVLVPIDPLIQAGRLVRIRITGAVGNFASGLLVNSSQPRNK
ncbi:MAG: tRNA (N(6)-L-threonylcarbamoyladenosine(37)-C(2))-methylthiotransferase MtaB [Dissulfurispiraceae bacterium]